MARVGDLGSQLKTFYGALTPGKRVALAAVVLLGLGAVAAVAALATRVEYAPLFVTGDAEDVAETMEKLKERKVPFKVEGRTLLVPTADVERLRLELRGQKATAGAGPGFELLDKPTWGRGEFQQKLDYERALMGELARTIRRLEPVETARVHLVLPTRRLYDDRREEASASIVLKLRSGQHLGREQVSAVVHLVASAVKGLRPERVTVVDEHGRLLWKRQGGNDVAAAGGSDFDRTLERRASSLLEAVVGQGKALVMVSTELETQSKEETIEAIDPDSRVERTVQETRDSTSTGGSTAGGLPGTRSNLAAAPTAPPTSAQGASRSSSVRSYELTRTRTRTVDPGGRIKKRSVAVLVDGRYEDKDGKRVFVPRSAEEVKSLEDLVKGAVGFQVERGDVVTVRSIAFETPPVAAGVEAAAEPGPPVWQQYARWGGIAAAILFFFLFVVRPVMRAVAQSAGTASRSPSPEGSAEVLAGADGAAALALGAPKGESVEIPSAAMAPRDVAKRLIEGDPRRAAEVIRTWLSDKDKNEKAA